ncbi:MAG: 3-dehydroquinate synthase [Magnetococcales bacterium]|nr:3-dehydroquinate synthase [Magnetococcales bacterium]NGZ07690.1 3-dehydroquinate synthase [Magnetococcales bacterium]
MPSAIQTLTVDLGPRSYEILIGASILDQIGQRMKSCVRGQRVAVVSNTTVAPLHLHPVQTSLEEAGFFVTPIILPDGEIHKNWNTLQQIFDHLIANRFERADPLLALGGGVIGDMTGFAAACHLRGVPFVQIPTTLLAQVDASVGGKTGINHPLGKNLIGAFYQPSLVMIDIDTLTTLPLRERLAGFAEVIKYGILWDRELFMLLEERLGEILAGNAELLIQLLHRCCAIKAAIVTMDEREEGKRALLNLGHTFGHAIESLTGYDRWLHGEAVAAGMVTAAHLATRIGLCPPEEAARMHALIQRCGLPTQLPNFPVDHYLEAMTHDKKVSGGRIRFILPERIGHTIVRSDLSTQLLRATLEANMEPSAQPTTKGYS